MYKLASRKLQRVHVVDRPHPSRGYIHGASDPADVLPEVCTLSLEDARAEAAQLRNELIRVEQQVAVARVNDDQAGRKVANAHRDTICTRLSVVNKRIRELDGDSELFRLRAAVGELADRDLADRIFARAKELRAQPAPASESPQKDAGGGCFVGEV